MYMYVSSVCNNGYPGVILISTVAAIGSNTRQVQAHPDEYMSFAHADTCRWNKAARLLPCLGLTQQNPLHRGVRPASRQLVLSPVISPTRSEHPQIPHLSTIWWYDTVSPPNFNFPRSKGTSAQIGRAGKSSARFECVCLLLEINLHRFDMRAATNLEIAQYSFPKNLQLSCTGSRYIIQQRREHGGKEMDQFTLATGLPTGNTSTAVLRAISSNLGAN